MDEIAFCELNRKPLDGLFITKNASKNKPLYEVQYNGYYELIK